MKLLLIFVLSGISILSYSATYTATGTGGEWTNVSTWVGGVVPPSAGSGDVVVIPSGSVVTISNQFVSFNGTVNISGTLSLIDTGGFPWAELDMNSGSVVNVLSGGQLASGGGGSWEWANGIVIGSNYFAYWPAVGAGNNPQTGPATMNATTTSGPMPVELLFFDAKVIGAKVDLKWATASEDNFDYFSLERSVDGKEFKEIAQISGMGNSKDRVDYEYEDEFPLIGRSYYRLKSVDFDGYTEVFDYAMIEFEGSSRDFEVYPNPIIDNHFSVQTNFDTVNGETLVIYNSMGKIETSYTLNSWLNSYDTNNLNPGSYLVKLTTKDNVLVKRILIK